MNRYVTINPPHHELMSVVCIYALCDCPPFIYGLTPVVFWWGDKSRLGLSFHYVSCSTLLQRPLYKQGRTQQTFDSDTVRIILKACISARRKSFMQSGWAYPFLLFSAWSLLPCFRLSIRFKNHIFSIPRAFFKISPKRSLQRADFLLHEHRDR